MVPALAAAHVILSPRVVQIRWEHEQLSVAMAVTDNGGGHVARQRGQFDLGGDGGLSREERERFADWLDTRSRRLFQLSLDGRALRPTRTQLDLADDTPDGKDATDDVRDGVGYTLRSLCSIEFCPRPGPHRLRVEDTPPSPGRLVPLRIDLPTGWTLGACHRGEGVAPLAPVGPGSWMGGFMGEAANLECEILVPPRIPTTPHPR